LYAVTLVISSTLYTLHSTLTYKGFDMSSPLIYILAPFGLAFALFAVFLIVSILLKDPARPFRMFGAPSLKGSQESRGESPEENEEEEEVREQRTVNGG
jgi:hypothetical protein